MADHLDAFDPAETLLQDVNPVDVPDLHLHYPDMDPSVDITDIYAFQKPGDPTKSILIMNVNPVAPALAHAFRPDAIYELNVDTNGDAVADIAFRIRFSEPQGGAQTATVHRATGALAAGTNDGGPAIIAGAPVSFGAEAQITNQNGYRFFAGLRSDPFFFDLLGFLQGLSFTGSDFFAGLNVFGIALEVPNTALGSNPNIGIWALTRSEEHTSELQSQFHLVCRLLLEKKKIIKANRHTRLIFGLCTTYRTRPAPARRGRPT